MVGNKEPLFSFEVALPKGKGKYKSSIASMNKVATWHWSTTLSVKKEFKKLLLDWYIPEASVKLASGTLVFELFRHNKKIIDSDNIGFIVKWTIDAIKESGWLIDDNQIKYVVVPSVVKKELKETTMSVTFFKGI
jgi:Holliday junction resolvase RusA-like endonuclease